MIDRNNPRRLYTLLAILSTAAFIPKSGIRADTLFKRAVFIGIGNAKTSGKQITWTPCQSQKSSQYVKPPYRVNPGDDCGGHLLGIGLDKGVDNSATVINQEMAQQVFPDIRKGDTVGVKESASALTLQFGNEIVQAAFGRAPSPADEIVNRLSLALGYFNIGNTGSADVVLKQVEGLNTATRQTGLYSGVVDHNAFGSMLASLADKSFGVEKPHTILSGLAEYQSSLRGEVPPDVGKRSSAVIIEWQGPGPPGGIRNAEFFLGPNDSAFTLSPDVLTAPAAAFTHGLNFIENVTVTGGNQVLDGLSWDNVTFVGTRIQYGGKPLVLSNVRFVHCTFESVNTESGNKMLLYALEQPPESLEIHPNLSTGY